MSKSAVLINGPLKLVWEQGFGPKEFGQYLLNKRNYSHKRTNKKK